MGNWISSLMARCFGIVGRSRQKYLRTMYNVDQEQSIEDDYAFENLMDGDNNQDEMSRLLTDRERQLLKSRQFDAIVHEQTKIDMEVDEQNARLEDDLRREEESYLEAKREASRIAKLQRAKEKAAQKNAVVNGSRSWLGDDDEWEVAGGEDDFELFLANVKARSIAARAEIHARDDDGQWPRSPVDQSDKPATADSTSLDLEFELEADGQ